MSQTPPQQSGIAVEPYYGGSHRQFLDNLVRLSRHRWTIRTGQARSWKWRMRSFPLMLVKEQLTQAVLIDETELIPCGMIATSMLDLPAYRGILASQLTEPSLSQRQRQWCLHLLNLPTAIYFHENQLSYPISPHAREDFHYGYTNILSAVIANEIWFNSEFHRDDFIQQSAKFIAKMPDGKREHQLDELCTKSRVLPPGFQPVSKARTSNGDWIITRQSMDSGQPLRIGWVARWEYDKRPDQFLSLLQLLENDNVPFELILLGSRGNQCETLLEIESRFADRIVINQHAETTSQYHRYLKMMDIVISTADHEFFGIGVCEAISAGAVPLLPLRLSYPELAPRECLYRSLEEAVQNLKRLTNPIVKTNLSVKCQNEIKQYIATNCIANIDHAFQEMTRFNQ